MKVTWVVALLVVASTAGAALQADESDCPVEIGASDEPGQELANVVGAQESVVAREIERRGFNATLANATSPEERATVVATELERIDIRLSTLESCQEALVDAREDGDLTDAEYRERARMLESDIEDASESLAHAEDAARDLSSEVRAEADIEPERFEALGSRVDDLEAFVARPERAIESRGEAGATAPPESTPDDTPAGDRTDLQSTTSDSVDDTPDETTPTTATATDTPTSTPTETPTKSPTPAPDTPTERETTTERPDDSAAPGGGNRTEGEGTTGAGVDSGRK